MIPLTITPDQLRVGITIPAAGGRVRDLLNAANPGSDVLAQNKAMTFLILGVVPVALTPWASTDRAAFVIASPRPGAAIQSSDYTTHGQPVATGEDYTSPSAGDLDSYVKAASDSPAIVVLFW